MGGEARPGPPAGLGLLGQISDTALTDDKAIEFEKSGLPNTFVPGRNIVFFTFAAAVAYRRGVSVLVGGMCETDYSGYPDCRDDTLHAWGYGCGGCPACELRAKGFAKFKGAAGR